MCIPIESVGEQTLHAVATVLPRRQTDRVDHDQVNAGTGRAGSEIGGLQSLRLRMPALSPKRRVHCPVFCLVHAHCRVSQGYGLARQRGVQCCSKALFDL